MNLKSALIGSAAAGAMSLAAPAQADYYVSIFGGMASGSGDTINIGGVNYYSTATASNFGVSTTIGKATFTSSSAYFKFTAGYLVSSGIFTVYATTLSSGFSDDNMESGFVFGAAFGMDLNEGWRAELEMAWRSNDIGENHSVGGTHFRNSRTVIGYSLTGFASQFTTSGSFVSSTTHTTGDPLLFININTGSTSTGFSATAVTSGEVSTFAVMANVWRDFDLGGNLTPFVGMGIGMVNVAVEYSGNTALPSNTVGSLSTYGTFQNTARFATDTDGWTWGWQAGAGVAYDLGGMSLSAQYRYFATGNIDVLGQDYGVTSHDFIVGLTIPFGN